MNEFEDRLRRAMRRRADQATVSPDGLGRIAERSARRRWMISGIGIAVAAAIVLGAVITLSSLLDLDRGDLEFIEQPAVTETAPTDAPSAPTSDAPSSAPTVPQTPAPSPTGRPTTTDTLQWTRVDDDPATFAPGSLVTIYDAVFLPSGRAVAVGEHLPPGRSSTVPTAWTSDRPGQWRLADGPASADDSGSGGMIAITAFGDDVVAVGAEDLQGAAWRSSDGETWQRADPDAFGPDSSISDVAATDELLIAVGETIDGIARDGVVWTSADGLSWQRVDGLGSLATVDDVEVRGSTIVALARDGLAAVSSDGRSWQLTDTVPDPDSTTDVFTATDRGYLRLGTQSIGSGDKWRLVVESADTLIDWSVHPVADSIRARGADAVQTGDIVTVVGTDTSKSPFAPSIFAGSVDGDNWTRVYTDLDGGAVEGVAVGPDRVVAVGQLDDGIGAVWEAPLP